MTALYLFVSTFTVVLALGLQSLNVNGRHYRLAFFNSFLIGGSNLVLFKTLPGPTEYPDLAAYLLGGPLGIVTSIWLHPWLVAWLTPARKQQHDKPAAKPRAGGPVPFEQKREAMTFMVTEGHMRRYERMSNLCADLTDPERFAHAVSQEVRDAALRARGITCVAPATPPTPSATVYADAPRQVRAEQAVTQ